MVSPLIWVQGKSLRAMTCAGRDTWRQPRYLSELSNDGHERQRAWRANQSDRYVL
jgi:hypothetical protein